MTTNFFEHIVRYSLLHIRMLVVECSLPGRNVIVAPGDALNSTIVVDIIISQFLLLLYPFLRKNSP
jgi:hypothetical protein